MTSLTAVRDVSKPLSDNKHLLRWVEKMASLTRPAAIHWVNGSQEEYDELCQALVDAGTFIRPSRPLHAQRRCAARSRRPGCAMALQHRKVHRSFPGNSRNLVLRIGLWR